MIAGDDLDRECGDGGGRMMRKYCVFVLRKTFSQHLIEFALIFDQRNKFCGTGSSFFLLSGLRSTSPEQTEDDDDDDY